jgi:hypothetical protein
VADNHGDWPAWVAVMVTFTHFQGSGHITGEGHHTTVITVITECTESGVGADIECNGLTGLFV